MPIYTLNDFAPELPPDDECWIAPSAVLIGRVRLLKNASVWFGAVLRGDTDWLTVGENSNVQDNSVVHADPGQPTTIGANVTVGHNVILHSATIGDNSLIGMGAIVLNRARIGQHCIVGANALVAEGKEFPDGTLILGSPARVARELSEPERTMLKFSAQHYVENHRRFREQLKQIG
jgi:carbonic anhydrase/acetyltransferase-like protein (isoleucine patch superfamily)